jgi:serine/threonine-protein kinase/endoribonuclease IRE1
MPVDFDDEAVLGDGSRGTIVYRGSHGGVAVAVKVMNKHEDSIQAMASKEIKVLKLLAQSGGDANIVQCLFVEETPETILLALELCGCSLSDLVERKHQKILFPQQMHLLRQVAMGLTFLHTHNPAIVHNDLRPANILLKAREKDATDRYTVKIADFGLSKILGGNMEQSAGDQDLNPMGFGGWYAPELLAAAYDKDAEKFLPTPKVDVFSFGCLIYYVMCEGGHPFDRPGQRASPLRDLTRTDNVKVGASSTDALEQQQQPAAAHLVQWMIAPSPSDRPFITQATSHPLFSNPNQTLVEWLGTASSVHQVASMCEDGPRKEGRFQAMFAPVPPFHPARGMGNGPEGESRAAGCCSGMFSSFSRGAGRQSGPQGTVAATDRSAV